MSIRNFGSLIGGFCIALSLCGYAAAVPQAQQHLYVGAYANNQYVVYRFPMVDGVPALQPDLTIPNASGALAASPAGSGSNVLYATDVLLPPQIDAFVNGATFPSRKIMLPKLSPMFFWQNVGMAVDHEGYLYVGVVQNAGSNGRRGKLPRPQQAIFVYGPDANGPAKPVQVITHILGGLEGVALDNQDDVLILSETNLFVGRCEIVANARSHPRSIGSFTSAGLGRTYGVTASADDVFVSTFVSNPYRFVLNVFPTSSRGVVSASRSTSATSGSILGPLAYFARTIFVAPIDVRTAVFFFHAIKGGPQAPFGSLPFANGEGGIAAGL